MAPDSVSDSPDTQILKGQGVSAGIAIAQAVCLESRRHEVYRFPLQTDDVDDEVERLHEAIAATQAEIARTRERVGEAVGKELAGIFDAYALILADAVFVDPIVSIIREERVNAEWAVQRVSGELGEKFARIENELFRERGEDLREVTRHLLRSLQGIDHHELSEIEEPVIIVADELTPAEAVRLGRQKVVGFAVESGGQTSHTTIMARALKIPLVVGLADITRQVTDQDPVIVDGSEGVVIIHPDERLLERYRVRQHDFEAEVETLARDAGLETRTRDGIAVTVRANIELVEELEDAVRFGARGVGLYRSEFLYIEKSPELPTEEEHFAVARALLSAAAPHPVVVRTFDLGGKKLAREVMMIPEENPSLGLRGIRLTLARPDIFKTQVRALMRAAAFGDLRVMLPLVSTVDEIRRFKKTLDEARRELEREGLEHDPEVPIGSMIEVPAAAVIADRLAREVQFVSIGTNDLIQYSLAVDRSNEHVAHLYQPLHPAVLTMIRKVVEAADAAEIEVSVCGEMAGDPRLTAILLGLGVRVLSMAPRSVPTVSRRIRELEGGELARVAERCIEMATAAEVESYLAALDLY